MSLPVDPGSPTDFDFFIGSWKVRHTRLKARLCSCTEWEEFGGLCVTHKILGGYGNVDDNIVGIPSGSYRAVTLRSYDRANQTWSIWWLDARSPGSLDVPVVGSFEAGVGTFLAKDTLDGRPIVVRFRWTIPAEDRPRWEQAFSADGGTCWETNWVMEFTRAT